MKKLLFIFALVILFALLFQTAFAAETDEIVMTLGSTEMTIFGTHYVNDVPPLLVNDRTMLPARVVAEALGADVEWNEVNQTVTIDNLIVMHVGSQVVEYIDGIVTLDTPISIINDRTYVPVRFLAEALGASVKWVEETQQIIIDKQGYVRDAVHFILDEKDPYSRRVDVPELIGDTDTIRSINKKMYDNHADALNLIKSKNKYVDVYYEYAVAEGYVGILIFDERSDIGTYHHTEIYGYYYDSTTDRELTFDEYMKALGVDYTTVAEAVNRNIDMSNEMTLSDDDYDYASIMPHISTNRNDQEIVAAIFDPIQTIVAHVGWGWGMQRFWTPALIHTKKPNVISDVQSTEVALSDEQKNAVGALKEYYQNEIYFPVIRDGYEYGNELNSFLADMDNDSMPELCVFTASQRGDISCFIYELENGNIIEYEAPFWKGYATGVSEDDQFGMEENGNIVFLHFSHRGNFGMDDNYYYSFYWNKYYDRNVGVTNFIEKIDWESAFSPVDDSHYEKITIQIGDTYPIVVDSIDWEPWHTYHLNVDQIDYENCGFFEIFEKQLLLRSSYAE